MISADDARKLLPPINRQRVDEMLEQMDALVRAAIERGEDYAIVKDLFSIDAPLSDVERKTLDAELDDLGYTTMVYSDARHGKYIYLIRW